MTASLEILLWVGMLWLGSFPAPASDVALPVPAEVGRLARALTYPTVSLEDASAVDREPFLRFHDFLQTSYPLVHQRLEREAVNRYSLLYTWRGRRSDLRPLVLAAHLDVVPAAAASGDEWSHPPFAGEVAAGRVWGRGALDDKGSLIAILEAVESSLEEGFTPDRTILLAFGHDEEIGGSEGARGIAALLRHRGVRLAGVLDEGGAILQPDMVDGFTAPIALIGVAEKGEVDLRLVVENPGPISHASMPPSSTPVGILGTAIGRLEASPFPARIVAPVDTFLDRIAATRRGIDRLALDNRWLLGWLVERKLATSPLTNAMIRTTTAATMFRGSEKPNSITTAEAVINVRILPGDTVGSAIRGVRKRLGDERIRLEVLPGTTPRDPSPVSSTESWFYRRLEGQIAASFPGLEMVAPTLLPGGTDARHYAPLSTSVLRFSPNVFDRATSKGPHGVDESLRIEDFRGAIRFYRGLLRAAGDA